MTHSTQPQPRRTPSRAGRAAGVAAGIAMSALAPAAGATPVISGADRDTWNAANPDPVYLVTSTDGRAIRVSWSVPGVASGRGVTPVTVRLPGIRDGLYELVVRDRDAPDDDEDEDEDQDGGTVARVVRVDRTPPRITVTQPTEGLVVDQRAVVPVAYGCEDALTCTGPVPTGGALPTTQAGAAAFTVTATDDAGNRSQVSVGYAVRAVAQPAATAARRTASRRLRTLNATRLRPSAGAVVTNRRPVLRWTPRRGARLYNVQVFLVQGGARTTKILSAFPRGPRMRVPARRLAPGRRYVWRVWPYVGNRYTTRPHGISNFRVRG